MKDSYSQSPALKLIFGFGGFDDMLNSVVKLGGPPVKLKVPDAELSKELTGCEGNAVETLGTLASTKEDPEGANIFF